jgi:predicted RNase H-like nuclease
LRAQTYREACDIRFGIEGKMVSRQLFAILDKIRDVDSILTPDLQMRVREAHPEVSFAAMNGGQPMPFPKRSQEGRLQRRALLDTQLPSCTAALTALRSGLVLDGIDALACLWTALRIADGAEMTLPEVPPVDTRRLRQEIVA